MHSATYHANRMMTVSLALSRAAGHDGNFEKRLLGNV
jgi:hypothetical protein